MVDTLGFPKNVFLPDRGQQLADARRQGAVPIPIRDDVPLVSPFPDDGVKCNICYASNPCYTYDINQDYWFCSEQCGAVYNDLLEILPVHDQ